MHEMLNGKQTVCCTLIINQQMHLHKISRKTLKMAGYGMRRVLRSERLARLASLSLRNARRIT